MSNVHKNLAVDTYCLSLSVCRLSTFGAEDIKVSKLFGVSDLFSVDSVEVTDDYDAIYL